MGLEPQHVSTVLGDWMDAQQRIQDTLMAWHDVENHDNLKAWVDASHAAENMCEQLELPFDFLMEQEPFDKGAAEKIITDQIIRTQRPGFVGE